MLLSEVFDKNMVKLNLTATTKEAVFKEMIETISACHSGFDKMELFSVINDRENKMNTGITAGAAIPHGYFHGNYNVMGAIGISPHGVNYETLDNKPVYVIFMLLMGDASRDNHLPILNKVASLIKSEAFSLLRTAKSAQEVYDILVRFH